MTSLMCFKMWNTTSTTVYYVRTVLVSVVNVTQFSMSFPIRLINEGVDPNHRHRLGWTALMVAAMNRQHRSVDRFLQPDHQNRPFFNFWHAPLLLTNETVMWWFGVTQLSVLVRLRADVMHVPAVVLTVPPQKCNFQTDRRHLPGPPSLCPTN